ncbi:hypothetical protein E4G67_04500, partial [Candidatus Bathyarchaeota archaeon]
MSNIPLISRHKAFSAGTPGGGSADNLPCTSYDVPDFIRYGQEGTAITCSIVLPTGALATITSQIGATKFLPVVSGIPSSGLDAQLHAANVNLTLSNRGARARYDYYFWQGRDIWKYDSRIETSGIQDTFASWTIDATPVVAALEGTTLGMYPMLLGSGDLKDQIPYLCTAALDGSNVISIKKNLITGTWTSGIIGTLSFPGNRIPIAELLHNNAVYFITDQSDRAAVINFEHDSIIELPWPEGVRHPMDLNVFRGSVYCLNKTVINSGVAIFNVDPVLGISKSIQLATDQGIDMTVNNFHGRNMLFTCTVPGPPVGTKPYMMAFNWTSALLPGSGVQNSGINVWAVAETGNAGRDLAIFLNNKQSLADEWNFLSNGEIFRPGPFGATVRKSEEIMYRPWVDDLTNAPGGDEQIRILFRENSQDGSIFRQYLYRNDPNEDILTLELAFQSGLSVTGNHHFSYCTHRFGGGHYDGAWGKVDVTISGIEDLPSGKTRVWYVVDGDYLSPDAKPIKVTLLYGGQGTSLSTPHKNIATINGAISGTIVSNQLHIGLSDGKPQYIDWDTKADQLVHKARTNFVVLVESTGTVPTVQLQKKMSQVAFADINAEGFTYPTGPVIQGIFNNTANETYSTGPVVEQMLTNVLDFTFSTGPLTGGRYTNVLGDTFSTGPSTPLGSGVWTFEIAIGIVPTGINQPIWWGFRASQNKISGFGRAQGI